LKVNLRVKFEDGNALILGMKVRRWTGL